MQSSSMEYCRHSSTAAVDHLLIQQQYERMWWLVIDADDTKPYKEQPIDLDWYLREVDSEVRLNRNLPIRDGDSLWLFERPFRRISGLAHAIGSPYLYRKTQWWLKISVDQAASSRLRKGPLHHSKVVFRSEPFRVDDEHYDADRDPVLVRMAAADIELVRDHLARLP